MLCVVLLDGQSRAQSTSDQANAYVLCAECEKRFDSQGENWTLARCYQTDKKFPLRDMLIKATPVSSTRGAPYLADSVPGLIMSQLVYFAASVFWRGSIHDWKLGKSDLLPIQLGPYEQEFRAYLLGLPFPIKAALIINVFKSNIVAS